MAQKSLSRAIVEGGRSGSWQSLTYFEERKERQKVRLHLDHARFHIDASEKVDVSWTRSYMGWNDRRSTRMHILRKWLDEQIGRPWNEVKSELGVMLGKDDARWHLRDHVLYLVAESPFDVAHQHHFQVDEDGILCDCSDFDYPDRMRYPRAQAPDTWPPSHKNINPDGKRISRYSDCAAWAIVNRAGHPHWVCAIEWQKEVDDQDRVVYHPTVFGYVRPLSPEEWFHYQLLPMLMHRALKLEHQLKKRRRTNRYTRPRQGLAPLPEIKLIG